MLAVFASIACAPVIVRLTAPPKQVVLRPQKTERLQLRWRIWGGKLSRCRGWGGATGTGPWCWGVLDAWDRTRWWSQGETFARPALCRASAVEEIFSEGTRL